MNITCSVCGSDDDLRLMDSTLFPGGRYVACAECRIEDREPRPLLVLALLRGDGDRAKKMIRNRQYFGDKIAAEEVLELIEEREKRESK